MCPRVSKRCFHEQRVRILHSFTKLLVLFLAKLKLLLENSSQSSLAVLQILGYWVWEHKVREGGGAGGGGEIFTGGGQPRRNLCDIK